MLVTRVTIFQAIDLYTQRTYKASEEPRIMKLSISRNKQIISNCGKTEIFDSGIRKCPGFVKVMVR